MHLANASLSENTSSNTDMGDIIIRSYSNVGSLRGLGKINISAKEVITAGGQNVSYFIDFEAESAEQYARKAQATISIQDADRIIKAIDFLESQIINTERFEFTEIETKIDEISIILFNDSNGKINIAIKIGGIFTQFGSSQFGSSRTLLDLREKILRAKKHIEDVRI